jgi:hypothetical protein
MRKSNMMREVAKSILLLVATVLAAGNPAFAQQTKVGGTGPCDKNRQCSDNFIR